jgi:hypothetical protein
MYRVFFRLSPENWRKLEDRKHREHRRSEAETARAIVEAELEREGMKNDL